LFERVLHFRSDPYEWEIKVWVTSLSGQEVGLEGV
jgi:hypothetical protein